MFVIATCKLNVSAWSPSGWCWYGYKKAWSWEGPWRIIFIPFPALWQGTVSTRVWLACKKTKNSMFLFYYILHLICCWLSIFLFQVADINPLGSIKTAVKRVPPSWENAWISSERITVNEALDGCAVLGSIVFSPFQFVHMWSLRIFSLIVQICENRNIYNWLNLELHSHTEKKHKSLKCWCKALQYVARVISSFEFAPCYIIWETKVLFVQLSACGRYTIGAAHGCFLDDDIGSLSRGKMADFVILSVDSWENFASEVEATVEATYVGGVLVYSRRNHT